MKKILFILILSISILSATAQKEIYIANDSAHTVSTQGISVNAIGKAYFETLSHSRIQYDFNYFYEKSISKPLTILFDGGLSYYQVKKELWHKTSEDGYFYISNSERYSSNYFNINFNIEPRFYFSLNNRTSEKRGGLNSGWFVGLPLNFGVIINNPESYYMDVNNEKVDFPKTSFNYKIKYGIGLNIGYRYAVTNKLFTEISTGIYYINNNDFRMGDIFPLISLNTKISLSYSF